ncbi:transposase [Streptomyces sp. NBC_01614]|uniref:transposase n=1 Tax=Streptomyces sp. NBC_01614 TaxID=2975897 RepID=UPI003867C57D
MKAELLDLPADVMDLERAEGVAGRLEDLLFDIAWIFSRTDLWGRAGVCVRGLLAPLSRKNGWRICEYIGEDTLWGQQHLLDRAVWDADALRDFTRRYVIAGLEDDGAGAGPGGAGVLVVDETGFAKRGNASAGVARRYCGALVEFSLARRGGAGRLGERHRPGSDRPGAVLAPRVDKGP